MIFRGPGRGARKADAASKAGTSPQGEARGASAFAAHILHLDACTLARIRQGDRAHARRICAPSRLGAEPRFSARRRSRAGTTLQSKLSIAKEGSTPQIEPQRTAYLNDFRAAGAPEN